MSSTALQVWVLGGASITLVTLVLRVLLARPRSGEVAAIAAALEPADIAYLARGREHAIETAVTGLVHRGVLVAVDGELRTGDPVVVREHGAYRGSVAAVSLSDVEAHLVGRVRAGVRTVAELVEDGDALEEELRARLGRRELLAASTGRAWLLRAPSLAWLAFGGVEVLIGLAQQRPSGGLVGLLLLGAWLVAKLRLPRRTGLGQKVLWHLRRRADGLEATATATPAQLDGRAHALAYALFGGHAAPGLVLPSAERELARASLYATAWAR